MGSSQVRFSMLKAYDVGVRDPSWVRGARAAKHKVSEL